MKNKYIKKLIIAILCLLLVPCTTTLATPAASSQYLTDSELLAQISKEDLFVPEESAAYVAEFHIRDMTATGTTEWDEDTHIVNVVEMYDETGEEITAYAFELDKGYITISASVDVPNPILEWSDVGEPVYAEFNLGNADKIIYLGGYNYYKDTGTDTLETLSGQEIERSETVSVLDEIKDINNVSKELAEFIVEEKIRAAELADVEVSANVAEQTDIVGQAGAEIAASRNTRPDVGLVQTSTPSSGYIVDPFEHAESWYGGTYTAHDFINMWESWAKFSKTRDFSETEGNCGPTAITNMLRTYGDRYNKSTITSQSASAIYTAVRKIGTDNLWYGGSAGGTSQTTANLFIRASFSHYGVAVTVNGRYSSTYSNISSSLSNNRLLYLSTDGYAVYGDHAVICYAYTRLESSNGGYRAYLKVMDGHNSSARYIDLTALGNTNSKYWEVCF